MRANATCERCGVRWYLAPHEHDVKCDRGLRSKKCGGRVVREHAPRADALSYYAPAEGLPPATAWDDDWPCSTCGRAAGVHDAETGACPQRVEPLDTWLLDEATS